MKTLKITLALCVYTLSSTVAQAYELTTHGWITLKAYERSVLSPSNPRSIQPALGFDRLLVDRPFVAPFANELEASRYYDNMPTAAPGPPLSGSEASLTHTRKIQLHERIVLQNLVDGGFLQGVTRIDDADRRIDAWMIRGAIREDDNGVQVSGLNLNVSQARDSDPYGEYLRAFGHFYDPLNSDVAGAFRHPKCGAARPCTPSIQWALGRSFGPVTNNSGVLDFTRRNHFTWEDARNNYWWALTLERDEGASGRDALDRKRDSQERQWRWASAIKDVGHVIHLLQDAGQPQHTRNDAHAPPVFAALTDNEEANDAGYEAYTDGRLLNSRGGINPFSEPLLYMDEGRPSRRDGQLPSLVSGNYPTPQFRFPVEFFTTKATDTIALRRGLADYSNRGFFTNGTMAGMLGRVPYDLPRTPGELPGAYEELLVDTRLRRGGQPVMALDFVVSVSDAVLPNYDAQNGAFSTTNNKVPLLRGGVFGRAMDLVPPSPEMEHFRYVLHYQNLRGHADSLIPRAIAYSAGMIDYFFRGRLEVMPIDQNVFAVLHQNVPHTIDSDGYPRKPNGDIFGFEQVRLRVRNTSEPIIESGSVSSPVAQIVTGGTLVAVARYHRNACYKPDLSGERVQSYTPPQQPLNITEPTCSMSEVKRTTYQEVSVSERIPLLGEADLPGGRGAPLPAAVEKMFDFSSDPIPVNATDLFIQVVYRGPLGDEPDAIAVGTFDVREPTFVGIFNSTDFFYNGTSYLAQNGTFPRRAADNFNVCAGFPSRFMFRSTGNAADPSLGLPFAFGETGVIRLAFVFGPPIAPATTITVRSTPAMNPAPSALSRSGVTKGLQRQASKEQYAASGANSLPAPTFCQNSPPAPGANVWCFDPIQKRRGLLLGDLAQAIYYNTSGVFSDGPDVDSVPLPIFSMPRFSGIGDNRFNVVGPLVACPAAPASMDGQDKAREDWTELHEEALELGVDPVSLK